MKNERKQKKRKKSLCVTRLFVVLDSFYAADVVACIQQFYGITKSDLKRQQQRQKNEFVCLQALLASLLLPKAKFLASKKSRK